MKALLAALCCGLCIACGTNASPDETLPYLKTDKIMHRVVAIYEYLDYREWQHTPWYRLTDDPQGPYFLLVDAFGCGCLVPPSVWAMAPEFVHCASGWRRPRP